MGFKVDFDALDTHYYSIATQVGAWQEQLEEIAGAIEVLSGSDNMSGSGADSIRSYMQTVHSTILATISELLSSHCVKCRLYMTDYQRSVDTDLHAVIVEDELSDLIPQYSAQNKKAIQVYDETVYALSQIKDIFYVTYPGVSGVDGAHTSITQFMQDLKDEINSLESSHLASDFTESEEMIASIQGFIEEMSAKSRSYMTSFTPQGLAGSDSFRRLYAAHLAIQSQLEADAPKIESAEEFQAERVAQIQAEIEERERKAKIINWVVTGVCIVGSVAAIALTGGAAAPLVVGAISAVSGAVIAGTKNLTGQYVQNGSLAGADWMSFGKDVFVGAVTGFVTGYVGASVGGAITSGLSNTSVGSTLLTSSNAFVRIGTGAAIGSVSQVGSGIVSRGAGSYIASGGDLDAAMEDAFDTQQMVVDAVIGGASGGITEYKQYKADMAVRDYNEIQNPVEHAAERGYELESGKNGTLEYSGTDYIKTSPDGQEIIVEVEASGSRSKDFSEAWEIAEKKYGVSKSDYTDVTWQHMDDYNVRSNKFTLELVDRSAHQGIKHAGGCKQYEVYTGVKYK